MNPDGLNRRRYLFRTVALGACLLLLLGSPGSGYTLLRVTSFTAPPAFWPVANLPLPMRIDPAGSDNVPDNSDTDAIIAGQATWNRINTDYFVFAAPTVAAGTALNASDGINSIFFDETGANFGAGSSAIAFTSLNINGATGVISDADLLFNGTLTFSTATPTPVTMPPTYDIQSIATHELGHVTGLDHAGLVSAVMFPIGADGAQFARNLTSDDRLGDSFVYPEAIGGAGIAGLQAGDGDLNQTTGGIAGFVRTSGGTAVPGAHVVAVDANGSATVSDVSHPDGSYLLTGLSPGNYQVYVEPLDGVTVEQDLSQSDHMNAFTPFNTTFLGGNASPATVAVTAGSTNSGNVVNLGSLYGVETEANNTFSAANPVALEALMSGIVNPATDVDYFSFAGTSGDFVNIDADSSGDKCPLDPVLTLFSTNGTTVLASNNDLDQKGNDSRIAFRLAATGTFFVRVSDSGAARSPCPTSGPGAFYTLHVNKAIPETEANNTRATANAAALGQYRGGILTSGIPVDTDFYVFSASFGDRLLADITANRAGSPLNPALTLLDNNGVTLASCTNNSASDLDCAIDFTFLNQPSPFYIQVTAQAGAGSSSFYVLHLGTDSFNTYFSGIAPLGTGVTGAGVDIFPKFVQQGTSFDLLVAGEGIPLDPTKTLSVTGPGVTLSTTSPAFGTIGGSPGPMNQGAGIDFFAMSAAVSASAAPGTRTIFTQNATLKAALSGGLVITPAAVPPEIAPTSAPLAWSGPQMVWSGNPSADSYNVYRGNLSGLVDLDANGTADNYGSSLACGITAPIVADPGVPALGDGFFYLVAGVNANGEGTLGFTRNNAGPGPERPKSALTGPCP